MLPEFAVSPRPTRAARGLPVPAAELPEAGCGSPAGPPKRRPRGLVVHLRGWGWAAVRGP